MALCISLEAGVLLSKKSEAEIGNLVESETSISLQVQYGAVEYKKNTLLWYSTQRDIDTLFKAGQKAAADGNPPAARILLELSIEREPTTSSEARAKLETLSKEPQPQTVSSTSNADAAKPNITDGEKLVAQESKELVETRTSKTAEEPQKPAVGKDVEEMIATPSTMTREEKLANLGLAAGLALVALIALWQITMKEPK